MILDEDTVALALAVMGDGERAYRVTMDEAATEAKLDETHARLYLSTSGTVGEREALVTINVEYQNALHNHNKAKAELARFKAEKDKADAVTRIWQTESANARAAERIR